MNVTEYTTDNPTVGANYLRFIRGLALDALQTSKDTGMPPEEALANIIECIHQDTIENLEFLIDLTDDSDDQN